MKSLPLPFSPRFTLFCEGAESEHQRTMKKNNNLAEGDYLYLFLAVRVEVGAPCGSFSNNGQLANCWTI